MRWRSWHSVPGFPVGVSPSISKNTAESGRYDPGEQRASCHADTRYLRSSRHCYRNGTRTRPTKCWFLRNQSSCWKSSNTMLKPRVGSMSPTFTRVLTFLLDWGYERLDGSTEKSESKRYPYGSSQPADLPPTLGMPMIDRFHKDPDTWIFLISTLAGGTGLNLVGANKVVIFGESLQLSLSLILTHHFDRS